MGNGIHNLTPESRCYDSYYFKQDIPQKALNILEHFKITIPENWNFPKPSENF